MGAPSLLFIRFRQVLIIHIDRDEIGGVQFGRLYSASMRGGDKDSAMRMSSLTNEEPLMVVKSGIDIMWEVIREDSHNGGNGMVREREASLCRGRDWRIGKRLSSGEDGDVSRDGRIGRHQGSKVFLSRGGHKDIIRINGDILVEWGKKESVEKFLCDSW